MSEIRKLSSSKINPVYIREFLTDRAIGCDSISHQASLTLEGLAEQLFIPLHQFARAQVLRDNKGYVIAILPLGCHLDFVSIKNELGREFEMAWPEEYSALFSNLNSNSIPPISILFDMECVIDAELVKNESIFLADGSGHGLLKMNKTDFLSLQKSPHIINMTAVLTGSAATKSLGVSDKTKQMREKIAKLDTLPVMPEVASKLLKMSRDPETMPEDIAAVVETDPAIVAQVMHYARSPWYGFKGEINSVKDAIFSILGMDMVTNMALGMAAGKVFTISAEGKLSAKNLWQHSVYCAALSEGLARVMPVRFNMKPGTAYLTGLLHNIGFMIMAHCFPDEFIALSEEIEANSSAAIINIEEQVYGLTHAEVGADLMRRWDLPEKVIHVMRHHHDEQYDGEFQHDVLLVQLANRIMANMNVGDETNADIDSELLGKLGLSEEAVDTVVETIFSEHSTELDKMATLLAA